MSRIAHISDLHFGTETSEVVTALREDLLRQDPSLVIVSGDLSQRATDEQFKAAHEFLQTLPFPQLIVPGNHDIPLFNVWKRFVHPLRGYRTLVTTDMFPTFINEDMAVLGINTARSFTWKNGRINEEQITHIIEFFKNVDPSLRKILVTHHPFVASSPDKRIRVVAGAETAVQALDECGVDVVLMGHLHKGFVNDVRRFHPNAKRSILMVQAGTALSKRLRSEPNSYNLITTSPESLTVSVRMFDGESFDHYAEGVYGLEAKDWQNPQKLETWIQRKSITPRHRRFFVHQDFRR